MHDANINYRKYRLNAKNLGRASTTMISEVQKHPYALPDVSAEQRASSDLVKRIRKLYWMGRDDEALQLQHLLRSVSPTDIMAADPADTD